MLSLVRQEDERRRCCEIQSAMWNQICRELGREDLAPRMAVEADERVELDLLLAEGRHVADTVAAEALALAADEIALAGPRAKASSPLERRLACAAAARCPWWADRAAGRAGRRTTP